VIEVQFRAKTTGQLWANCYHSDHSGQLSLAVLPWIGTMTGDGTITHGQENGEFRVTVGRVITRTAGILT